MPPNPASISASLPPSQPPRFKFVPTPLFSACIRNDTVAKWAELNASIEVAKFQITRWLRVDQTGEMSYSVEFVFYLYFYSRREEKRRHVTGAAYPQNQEMDQPVVFLL